ncbi:MAG: DUF3090 family protein [Ilumatobacteraceae bacterium]
MSIFFEFDEVDSFQAAAIGEPGSRVFYLHARAGTQRVSVKCEKQQVRAIAQYLRRVLSDLPPPEDRPMPATDLRDPGEQSFVLGPIGLGYDRGNDRLLVQLEELTPSALVDDDDDDDEADDDEDDVDDDDAFVDDRDDDRGHIRLYVTRSQAAAFCDHADELVAAGRPNCMWCGNPIDPDGHQCPRMN